MAPTERPGPYIYSCTFVTMFPRRESLQMKHRLDDRLTDTRGWYKSETRASEVRRSNPIHGWRSSLIALIPVPCLSSAAITGRLIALTARRSNIFVCRPSCASHVGTKEELAAQLPTWPVILIIQTLTSSSSSRGTHFQSPSLPRSVSRKETSTCRNFL